MSKPKVLLIGWDAADWKLINPLLEQGLLPSVEKMINNGVMGNLATLKPILSPMLWNSIGTGKRPYKHGVHGFTEVNPHTSEVSPALSTSRKVKAIWNMLSQEGLKAHVVNWFVSHPPEAINGICISELYSKMPQDPDGPWAMPPAVHPEEMSKTFEDMRLHPKELDGETLQMFAPLLHRIDQKKDKRVYALAKQIAEAFTIHNAATHILENEEWDFLGVYYGCIDHFCHLFMYYHPPKMNGISDEDFEIFSPIINACYIMHDRMLGRLLDLAGEEATVIVCSDHGFHSDELRPPGTPEIPAGPAVWHRDQGIIMLQGPNIRKDQLVHGANLLDITPTVLHAMGLPIGRDMDGRPLLEVFDSIENMETIGSWEKRKGDHPDGMHSGAGNVTKEDAKAILDQFVALGYIDAPDADADKAAIDTERELKWNLARSFLDAGDLAGAIPTLKEVVDQAPDRSDYVITLANCLQSYGLHEEAEQLLRAAMPDQPNNPDVRQQMAEFALARGDAESALEYLKGIESTLEVTDGTSASRWLTLGLVWARLREWDKAIVQYERAVKADPDFARGYLGIAQCLVRLRRYEEAVDAALHAVELEHHLATAHFTLGMALARTERPERAVDAFSTSLRYAPNHMQSHRMLSLVYTTLEMFEQALFHRTQASVIREDRQIGRKHLEEAKKELAVGNEDLVRRVREARQQRDADQAKEAAEQAKEAAEQAERAARGEAEPGEGDGVSPNGKEERKTFVLVSGLPRSGTSLMMQMLNAGGLEAMTDHERTADEDNPEGYLEWEAIKRIKAEPELMEQAEGKVTKVISMLIPHLPKKHDYKIIFVARPVEEIVASQAKMIERRGTTGADLDEEALAKNLKTHRDEILSMIKRSPIMDGLVVHYGRLINKPQRALRLVVEFLGDGAPTDLEAMAAVVRPELYRNRSSKSEEVGVGADAGDSGDDAES